MAETRTSKIYTISLPPDLAVKAESLAQRDSRTMSELFREAFRVYYSQQARMALEEINAYAATRNPQKFSEADLPGVIREMRREEKRKTSATPAKPARKRA